MGITGLLPFLKDASTSVNIKDFAGQTVAVDTYCWIYRGAFSCAEELALGKKADGHVKYVLKYVTRFLEWGIKPIMVFDGACLPSKKGTELKRRESKDNYRKRAAQCLREGKRTEARELFQRCIDCTPQMALDVIQAMHALGVDCCIAPYEADAQLCYLNKIGVAQVIITEDSDLVLFGCEKVLYKLDINGCGTLVEKEKIISITQFDSADNFQRFRWMCILSGCDYLESLPGIGLGKAKKLLKTVKKSDIDHIFKQLPKVLKMPNLNISAEYIESFKKADKTFKYQIVFDPIQRRMVSLHPYEAEDEKEDLSFAGFFYDDEIALQHSLGNIEVHTRAKHYDFNPANWRYKPPTKFMNNPPPYMRSIWTPGYKPRNECTVVNVSAAETKKNFFNLNTGIKAEIVRPSTAGIVKTLKSPFKPEPVKKEPAKQSPVQSNKSKRKFAMLDQFDELEDSKPGNSMNSLLSEVQKEESSSMSSASDTDNATSGDSMGKRSRLEDCKNDIDNLLSAYTEDTENNADVNSETPQSDEKLFSPIKELLVFSEKSNVSGLLNSLESETMSAQSPILAKKSSNALETFKLKSNNKFLKCRLDLDEDNVNAKTEPKEIQEPTLVDLEEELANEKKERMINDIENIAIKSQPNKQNSVISANSGKSRNAKKIEDPKNTKPITSFFKFEFKRTNKVSTK